MRSHIVNITTAVILTGVHTTQGITPSLDGFCTVLGYVTLVNGAIIVIRWAFNNLLSGR